MKVKFKLSKKNLYRDIPVFVLALYMLSCISITKVGYKEYYKAGETATFTMDIKLDVHPAGDESDTRLIAAMLVPKSWKAATNMAVTYTSSIDDEGKVTMTMKKIPDTTQPAKMPGMSWPQALRERFDFVGNVLDDMEWVAYQSEVPYNVVKGQSETAKIKFVTKIGPENMRVKLAFFVNHSKDGLGGSDHYKMEPTDCIDIVEGKGDIIDFCEPHFNMVQPSYATKDDILTFKFQGDIVSNDLDGAAAIYLNSVAYTDAGKEYKVTERTSKTKMRRELEYGKTYELTLWPADYYGIPDSESITKVDYFFTNEDGTLWVKETLEDNTQVPFVRQFTCDE